MWPCVLTIGTLLKLVASPTSTVMHAIGLSVLLSASSANWETQERPCKIALNASSIVSLAALSVVLAVWTVATIASISSNKLAEKESIAMLI